MDQEFTIEETLHGMDGDDGAGDCILYYELGNRKFEVFSTPWEASRHGKKGEILSFRVEGSSPYVVHVKYETLKGSIQSATVRSRDGKVWRK